MKNKGFSLAELLLVISIIGILSAMAGIAYKNWMDRYNVERQIKEMYADLMKAKIDAMSTNRFRCVTFSATGYTIREDRDPLPDGDGACDDAGDTIVLEKTLSSNYDITFTNTNPKTFNTRGVTPVGEAGTVSVTTDYGADYDCILIQETKINTGKMSGGSCVAK